LSLLPDRGSLNAVADEDVMGAVREQPKLMASRCRNDLPWESFRDLWKPAACPREELWICPTIAAPRSLDAERSDLGFIYFEVGANKGYQMVQMVQHFAAPKLTRRLFNKLRQLICPAAQPACFWACGACCDCQSSHLPCGRGGHRRLRAVAMDMSAINIEFLERFFTKSLTPTQKLLANMTLLAAVADTRDNLTGTMVCPTSFGEETMSAEKDAPGVGDVPGQRASCRRPYTLTRRSVDSVAAELGLPFIDLLHIDTEGFDPLVLQGARGLLQRGLVRVVVFELWSKRDMSEIFVDLLERFNYSCYIPPIYHANKQVFKPVATQLNASVFPFLIPVNQGCFRDELRHIVSWSNAVCHRNHAGDEALAAAFARLVQQPWQLYDAKPPLCAGFEKAMKVKTTKTKTK
jgi:hypothetical protein